MLKKKEIQKLFNKGYPTSEKNRLTGLYDVFSSDFQEKLASMNEVFQLQGPLYPAPGVAKPFLAWTQGSKHLHSFLLKRKVYYLFSSDI